MLSAAIVAMLAVASSPAVVATSATFALLPCPAFHPVPNSTSATPTLAPYTTSYPRTHRLRTTAAVRASSKPAPPPSAAPAPESASAVLVMHAGEEQHPAGAPVDPIVTYQAADKAAVPLVGPASPAPGPVGMHTSVTLPFAVRPASLVTMELDWGRVVPTPTAKPAPTKTMNLDWGHMVPPPSASFMPYTTMTLDWTRVAPPSASPAPEFPEAMPHLIQDSGLEGVVTWVTPDPTARAVAPASSAAPGPANEHVPTVKRPAMRPVLPPSSARHVAMPVIRNRESTIKLQQLKLKHAPVTSVFNLFNSIMANAFSLLGLGFASV